MVLQETFDFSSPATWLKFATAVFLGIIIYRHFFVRRKGLPPGPKGFPLIGYVSFLNTRPHETWNELTKIYGDVVCFKSLGKTVLHLGSYESIRDAFVIQGNEFAGRVPFPIPTSIMRLGLIPSEGEIVKIHRRFALQTLRDFGFGKLSLEERVQMISEEILKCMDQSNGKPIDVQDQLSTAAANVISSMVFDKSFSSDDQRFQKVKDAIILFFKNGSPLTLFFLEPLFRFIPLKYFPSVKSFLDGGETFINFVSKMINEHQKSFDLTFLRDYVDVYLAENKKLDSSEKATEDLFSVDRLKAITANLFIAGTETTSNSMYWLLRILMLNPDIQKKVQDEIDEVIGKERFPSVMDRPKMPYTEATINEVLRLSSLAPVALFHSNPEEVKFRGYIIPKRTLILANLWAAHHDPKYWPEPEKFDPTRFLGPDGKLEKRESFYPFSAGKRVCLGESLARMELFLYTTSIFQRFNVEPPQDDLHGKLNIEPTRFVRSIQPYKLCARPRFVKES